MFESIQEVNGQIVNNQWIEWDHVGVPNKPKEFRDIITKRELLSTKSSLFFIHTAF